MSVRDVVGRLGDAKNKLVAAKAIGARAASDVSAAGQTVEKVLDGVSDKGLSAAITVKAKAIHDEFNGVEGLFKGIDAAIHRVQEIGTRNR